MADYAATGTYAEAARRNGVGATTARDVVLRRGDLIEEADAAARAVGQSMEEYLRGQTERVQEVISTYLEALTDLDRFERLNPAHLSTVIGTLIDKWATLQRQDGGSQSAGVVILPEVDDG